MENRATHLILHHTGINSWFSQLLPVNRYHKLKRYPRSRRGWYIGYHHFITKTGVAIRTRDDDEIGAHTLLDWNDHSIGVCIQGNFNKGVPREIQLIALRKLIKQYNLPYKFHHEADKNRTCAGYYFTHDLIDNQQKPEPVIETEKAESIQRQISVIKALLAKIAESLRKL